MERENRGDLGFNYGISITRIFMRSHGIWPGLSAPRTGIKRYFYIPPALMIFLFINGPQSVKVFLVGGDLNAILKIFTLGNVPIGIALAKLLGISYYQDTVHGLIAMLFEDWKVATEKELSIMWEKARTSHKFSVICIILGEGTAFAYTIRMIYELCAWYSLEGSSQIPKPMYFTGKFPFNTEASPIFEIIWILQFVATTISAGAFAAVDALFITMALHLCGQLSTLQSAFKEIGRMRNDKKLEFFNKLALLIKKHQRLTEVIPLIRELLKKYDYALYRVTYTYISKFRAFLLLNISNVHRKLRFSDAIEKCFNMMLLIQVLSSTILLCLQGYLFVLIWSAGEAMLVEVGFMLYFTICFMFSIFAYCYIAELISEESIQLGNAIFYSKWYNLSPKKAKLLIICLLRVKRPLKLSAGKFCVFSLNLWCNIVRTSAGYMSVLLAVRDKL